MPKTSSPRPRNGIYQNRLFPNISATLKGDFMNMQIYHSFTLSIRANRVVLDVLVPLAEIALHQKELSLHHQFESQLIARVILGDCALFG
jgi:hypothetical protein